MDAYASVGMPVNYRHWCYGKEFIANEQNYRRGHMGLAYEIVINSDPCIAYLMEENTMAMQALVIAHAAYGHNSFFKGNYLFRHVDRRRRRSSTTWSTRGTTSPSARSATASARSRTCSTAAMRCMNYGVDRYRRPSKLSLAEELARRNERAGLRADAGQRHLAHAAAARRRAPSEADDAKRFPAEPQENMLYFIEKNAPLLEPWQREVVRIVRKIAQYFYPQRQTQVMNEGWATFWHYTLLNTLYDEGHLTDGFMIEWLKSHTNVIFQPPVGHRGYSGINPYALGFAMFTDMRRICEHPTDEDRDWFPDLAGTPTGCRRSTTRCATSRTRASSASTCRPKLIRDLRLFAIARRRAARASSRSSAIHDDARLPPACARRCRASTTSSSREPDIQVWSVNLRGDRSLTLRHTQHNNRPLHDGAQEVLKHVARLWGFGVNLESVDSQGRVNHRKVAGPQAA